ncbi:acetyl-CoA synthetase-like protein [Annulohypoxylon maeteangense]|uniref:acetyl-CoA synthetase-like protein n=1 Tax=Annulohypoxylon maeteangense TaxID=1927788 RepID=UPI002008843A|nr:acetyl-CoA synthetase-like protein [Annulohypoxylon maeteangense]KAI0882259.1 acetyl-CoA synthetase-like protein [Annulohypoxylon maeteangense]
MRLSGTGLHLIVNAPSSFQLLKSVSAAHCLTRGFIASIASPYTTYITPRPGQRYYQRSCSSICSNKSPLFGNFTNQVRMASTLTLPKLPIFEAIASHNPQSTAIVHCLSRRTFKYGELLPDVSRVRDRILEAAGKSDIRGERVAFLIENSYDYVVTYLAVLASHAIALPLSPPFPAPELQYILSQSGAILLLHSSKYASKVDEVLNTPSKELDVTPSPIPIELPKHFGAISETFEPVELVEDDAEGAGMMLYTSGTTNRPKGVLLPESALTAQARALIEAWKYAPSDRLLHVLPLHHIHGTVNAVLTPLFAGSSIEFLFPFNADTVWRRFASPFLDSPQVAAAVKANEVSHPVKTNGITNGVKPNGIAKPITNGIAHPVVKTNGFHPPIAEPNGIVTPITETNGTITPALELGGFGNPASSEISRLAAVISHLAAEVNNLAAKISQPSQPFALTNGFNHAISQQTNGAIPSPALSAKGFDTPIASTNGITTPVAEPTVPVKQPEPPKVTAPATEDKYKNMSRVKITFFTVVPTVYTRLLSTHKTLSPTAAEAGRIAISPEHMRVSISGSAALPTPVKRAWRELSRGNVLLERYGMTEVGMALSCGLDFGDRVDGSVGWPLPGVEARLVDSETGILVEDDFSLDPEASGEVKERSGEIQLRGKNVFREYWANPTATAKEFVPAEDGKGPWFKTGDVAVRRPVLTAGNAVSGEWAQGPMYFILGRQSADIIKSGGEKVSALEVERELLSLPEISEAAVVAVPSGKWGQKVGAVLIHSPEYLRDHASWRPLDMRRALKGRLANYKIPQVLRIVEHIPRNAMGKINKKDLLRKVFLDDFSGDEM